MTRNQSAQRMGGAGATALAIVMALLAVGAAVASDPPIAVTTADSATDPTGDTFGIGPIQIDATSISAEIGGGVLSIVVEFAHSINSAENHDPDSLNGLIDIDQDSNPGTGVVPWSDALSPSPTSSPGMDAYVDLYSFKNGTAMLLTGDTDVLIGDVDVSFADTSVTIAVPLSLLGGSAPRVAGIFGTTDEMTDRAPDNGWVTAGDDGPPPVAGDCIDGLPGGTAPCVESATTLCLGDNDRFEVRGEFEPPQGEQGPAQLVPETQDTGLAWFFNAKNIEILFKVLDGCDLNDRFWIFASGVTTVETTLHVRDTETGQTQLCFNPQGMPFTPILDTSAFATCP